MAIISGGINMAQRRSVACRALAIAATLCAQRAYGGISTAAPVNSISNISITHSSANSMKTVAKAATKAAWRYRLSACRATVIVNYCLLKYLT